MVYADLGWYFLCGTPFPTQNRFTSSWENNDMVGSILGKSVLFRMLDVLHPLHPSAGGHNGTFLHLMERCTPPLLFEISNGTCGAVAPPVLSANGIQPAVSVSRPGSLSHFCVLLANFAVETIESFADRLQTPVLSPKR
jgi:hypothetical protein